MEESDQSLLPSDLRAGVVIDGKYRIEGVLGRGGMGVVMSATHVHLGEKVALKFLQSRTPDDEPEDFRARFEREARVCARLRNPHVVRVLDVGVWQGRTPYMVMDLLLGRDLRAALKEAGRLPALQAVYLAVQICEGLAEAHALGIVHRDLKPQNIFLVRAPDGTEQVKVLDFGISKWASECGGEELTKAGTLLGSPKYMSPEQLSDGGVDARSDVWAIGALLYTMLTGRPPYEHATVTQTFVAIAAGTPPPPPRSIEPSIPPELEAVVLRCLVRDKAARVASVAELAAELLDALGATGAAEVYARLSAVLDPSAAPATRTFTSRLTVTTGSYPGMSLSGQRGSGAPLTASTAARASSPGRRRGPALLGLAGALAVAAGLGGAALLRPAEGTAAAAPRASSRAASSKVIAPELPTSLAPAAAVSPAASPAPFAVARRVYRPEPAPRPVPPAPPSAASAAPPPAPSAAPAASAKRAVNALDDRQ